MSGVIILRYEDSHDEDWQHTTAAFAPDLETAKAFVVERFKDDAESGFDHDYGIFAIPAPGEFTSDADDLWDADSDYFAVKVEVKGEPRRSHWW